MKKLMVAACAIAVGFAAQAASVNWGGAYADDSSMGSASAGMQFALVRSSSAITEPTSIAAWAIGTTVDTGTIVDLYTTKTETKDPNNWAFTGTYNAGENDVNGYYAVLGLNDDGTMASFKNVGEITGTTATSPIESVKYNAGWSPANKFLNDSGFTVAIAPEPTSGLLLLLGVAGLALRRRRA